MQAVPVFDKSKISRPHERGTKVSGKMVNQPTNNRHKDFKENPMSQPHQPLQSHRTNATEPESSSDQEDTRVAANKEIMNRKQKKRI